MHRKNEEYEIRIKDTGTNGEGIGHLDDGYTLFIQGALPGDLVLTRIIKAQKKYGIGRVQRIIEPSPDRVDPPCPVAGRCGGCQIMQLSYEAQLDMKVAKVKNDLIRLGSQDADLIESICEPVIGMDAAVPVRYRNKAQYPVSYDRDGELVCGFYAVGSHRVIPAKDCLLGDSGDHRITEAVLEWMRKYDVSAYDENGHSGIVRHIMIRHSSLNGAVMICLVINSDSVPCEKELIEGICRAVDPKDDPDRNESDDLICKAVYSGDMSQVKEPAEVICQAIDPKDDPDRMESTDKMMKAGSNRISIYININRENTNVILGKEYRLLYGPGKIEDEISRVRYDSSWMPIEDSSVRYRISPASFYQVNHIQTERLYSTALEYAGLTGDEIVWDLYCGIGTISLFLSKSAKEVYGIEVIPEAVEDAKENAALNGITNASFYCGAAEEILPKLKLPQPDVIVVDPPRKGCDRICLDTMIQAAPDRIVYVSCDPATLSRDIKYLTSNGYELKRIRPCDMFPNTVHIEVCCLLEQLRSAKEHIEITIDAADYYRIKESEKKSE